MLHLEYMKLCKMAICTNKRASEQISLLYNILKCMGMNGIDIKECESVYNQYIENESNYKSVISNVAMSHNENVISNIWLNLMVASNRYNLESSLKDIIDYHKIYIADLVAIMKNFGLYDFALDWINEYEDSLDTLKQSI